MDGLTVHPMPIHPLKYGDFECTGRGLTYDRHRRATTTSLKYALGMLQRRGNRTGAKFHPQAWWYAQVKHYNLQYNRDKSTELSAIKQAFEKLIKENRLKVPPELARMEKKLNDEYKNLEKEEGKRMAEEMKERMKNWKAPSPEISTPPVDYFNTDDAKERQAEIDALHNQLKSGEGIGNDISGTWHLNCPEVEQDYGKGIPRPVLWIIHHPSKSEDVVWASLDLIFIDSCIAKIEGKPGFKEGLSFTWRGRDAGTGELQWNDKENWGKITFQSKGECCGFINSEFGGPWEFRGKKVSLSTIGYGVKSLEECRQEFPRMNEKRWNKEQYSRWGGGFRDDDSDSDEAESSDRHHLSIAY